MNKVLRFVLYNVSLRHIDKQKLIRNMDWDYLFFHTSLTKFSVSSLLRLLFVSWLALYAKKVFT